VNEPLDAYLRVLGVDATWIGEPLRVIFSDKYGAVQDGLYEIETRMITAQTKTASIAGMAKGDTLTVREKAYVVDRVRADAANPAWSTIYLDINE